MGSTETASACRLLAADVTVVQGVSVDLVADFIGLDLPPPWPPSPPLVALYTFPDDNVSRNVPRGPALDQRCGCTPNDARATRRSVSQGAPLSPAGALT
jgi:hypothetical protein